MGRKIICPECNTIFDEDVLKQKNSDDTCLVCGGALSGEKESAHEETLDEDNGEDNWITWYYYGMKDKKGKPSGSASLRDKPIDLVEHGDTYFLIQEFKAPPESECGLDKVKEILRTYVPDAFVYPKKKESVVRCPRCFSTDFQLVPKKFSLLTGFATNRVDRVCVKCMKKF